MLGRFRWSWVEAPTWAPYSAEARTFAPLVAPRAERRRAQGALQVLQALTPKARGIFRLLAEKCAEQTAAAANERAKSRRSGGGRGGAAVGVTFHALFQACRERFLCSSQATLRSVLTEFADHELVSERRSGNSGADASNTAVRGGSDLVQVALSKAALGSVLAQIDAET